MLNYGNNHKNTSISTSLLTLTALFWGVGYVFQVWAMDFMEPLIFNGVRFGIAGLLMGLITILAEKRFHAEEDVHTFKNNISSLVVGLACGVVLFVAGWAQQWGIAETGSASRAGFITVLYIVFIPAVGLIPIKNRKWRKFIGEPTRYIFFGVAVAIIGFFLLTIPEGEGFSIGINIGDLAVLGGAFGFGIQVLLINYYRQYLKLFRFATIQFLSCSALSIALALMIEDIQAANVIEGGIPILLSAVFAVCLGYMFQAMGQQNMPIAKSLFIPFILSFETVFAAFFGVLILKEVLGLRGIAGGVLVFIGVVIVGVLAERQVSQSTTESCKQLTATTPSFNWNKYGESPILNTKIHK